ncbi:putative HTH-type transcriptional regulator YkvN [Fulvitalea axinellae]|uniref:HTH-type transcriptional regulator YkvN n=2 Tax=Fulvitalea axinellae TaxID=1182444 RepID=A0AAU9D9U1_9BACT|nr:putative HTH-type transcriptional regulator YkvN [Fulvitalea axinellae]
MEYIGGKWKPLILFHLIGSPKRSGELQKSICGISNKVFTESIREMEYSGLVNRKVFPSVPPKVEYSLTELGNSLIPILKAMDDWGKTFPPESHSDNEKNE